MSAETIPDDNFVLVMTAHDADMTNGKTGQHFVHFAYHKNNGKWGISKLPHRYYQLIKAMNKQRDPKYLFTKNEAKHIYNYIAKHDVQHNQNYVGIEQSKLGHIPTVKSYQTGKADAIKDLKMFKKKFQENKAKHIQHPFDVTSKQMQKIHQQLHTQRMQLKHLHKPSAHHQNIKHNELTMN